MTFVSKLAAIATLAALPVVPASVSAQVAYDSSGLPLAGLLYPYTDQSPYAVEHGERSSYAIVPTPYGTRVGVVARCNYPDGWNVTDFSRDINGIPAGIHHQCPEPAAYGHRLRSRF